jgi:hypothetical protein
MRWINSHRAATAAQVAKRFGISPGAASKRLCQLKSCAYLVYDKIFCAAPGVYRAGARGIAAAADDLPAARLPLGSYEHDLQLVDLALALEHKTGAQWQTERQIRHDKGRTGVGTTGHTPDGILVFPGGGMIAVELELSPKGAAKLEKILKEYAGMRYQEVWYFVNSGYLAARIRRAALPFIKVFSWPDMEEYDMKEYRPKPAAVRAFLESINIEEEGNAARDFFTRSARGETRNRGGIDCCLEAERKEARDFFRR